MSLKGSRFAYELAEIGARRDTLEKNKISCHVCSLEFDEKEIIKTMDELKLESFRDAGWLFYATSHPTCEHLQDFPKEVRKNILGKSIFHILYVSNK
jgi:hypothetical protein